MSAAAAGGASAAFTVLRRSTHPFLTGHSKTTAMITRRMKIRRHLRSVRASALTEEERRHELREAEARGAYDLDRDEPVESAASPRATDDDDTPRPPEAGAERAGVTRE